MAVARAREAIWAAAARVVAAAVVEEGKGPGATCPVGRCTRALRPVSQEAAERAAAEREAKRASVGTAREAAVAAGWATVVDKDPAGVGATVRAEAAGARVAEMAPDPGVAAGQ